MSKIIASAGIRGAHKIVARVTQKLEAATKQHGPDAKIGFPNTTYYLPITFSMLGVPVQTLGEAKPVLDRARSLLPPLVRATNNLPYLGPALDAGMAALFAEEIEEAIRYLDDPGFYFVGEDPPEDRLWVGAADDVILRKRGIEFVDGTAPGFAAILGAAPNPEIAKKIALELQQKNLYVFMASKHNGTSFTEQLRQAGVQIGWSTRLVPFGPDVSATAFALGFAARAALAFGGIQPGDFRKNLIYNKDRVFAFALTLGDVTDEWYANGLAAVNFGFPVIADTPIPEVLPTGVCTYEHVVSNIPHDQIVQKAIEVRGLKVQVSKVPVPVAYGPAFEGERIRGEDIYLEAGGGRTIAVELTTMKPMSEVEDGKVELFGPDLEQIKPGSRLPLGILAEVAGRAMQEDFEPILERQIHHLINYAQGLMHIGQRDIAWVRVGKQAFDKGLRLRDLGKILHAKYHGDFGAILDKVQVKIFTDEAKVKELLAQARAAYKKRDARIEGMTDEDTPTFYSCTLCQSFAPTHVCVVTPERTGLCGAYTWLDCRASNEINPTGPNQPIPKGGTLDATLGQWEGVNAFVSKASRGAIPHYSAYSIMNEPMTSCGCFECIAVILPLTNGIMIVDRDFQGMTPSGMKFTTLAGTVGGGAINPGFLGHSKLYISSRKYLKAEGGLKRVTWMPKKLKEEIQERFAKQAVALGVPDLLDRIADETVGTTEEEILPFLEQKQHPALTMDPLM